MNTLIALVALLAAVWLSIYGFRDIAEDAIGAIGLGLAFLFLVLAVLSAPSDWAILSGKDEPEEEE